MSTHPLSFASLDFATTPFLVIWETTQACPLACQHCRAEAQPLRHPDELTTDGGRRLLDQIRGMGTPVCVLSGGDPLRRPDLLELVRHGAGIGLRMATIPVASEELTRDHLAALRDAGLSQVAFSLDGSTAELHDNFRKVPGTYARTLRALAWARELEMPSQINTTLAQYNAHDLGSLIDLVRGLGIVFWEVFSLIPVGRGSVLASLTAEQHEAAFERLYALSLEADFIIKLTEAPHYRRYVLQQRAADANAPRGASHRPASDLKTAMPARRTTHDRERAARSAIPAQLSREMGIADSFGARARGINAGKGFCFVSHTGDVFPSGFLPLKAGNVRDQPLDAIYRDSGLLVRLRDPGLLKGRCGICEYADVCGGSRARAWATTGDELAEDPACLYQPAPSR